MLVSELLEASLRLAGAKDALQALNGQDSVDSFEALLLLVDSLTVEPFMMPSVTTESFTLSVGNNTRTIGSSGQFATTRPTRIESAWIVDGSDVSHPVKIIYEDAFARIAYKAQTARPTRLYYQRSYPTGTIYFDSKPDAAETLYINSIKPFAVYTSIGDSVNLPPAYERFLKYQLACDLADEYALPITSRVEKVADELRQKIKAMNATVPTAVLDSALVGHAPTARTIDTL